MIGQRLRYTAKLPEYEIAFHTLPDSELDACFDHERFREIAFVHERLIRDTANELEQKPLDADQLFRRQLELQGELDTLRYHQRPWLSLTAKERDAQVRRIARKSSPRPKGVRLASELTGVEARLARLLGKPDHLELILDWSRSNKELAKSFLLLVKELRTIPGTRAHEVAVKEARGRQSSSKELLFQLAIWRCRKAGLNTHDTLELVESLRKGFHGPDKTTLSKKLSSIERTFERAFFPPRKESN